MILHEYKDFELLIREASDFYHIAPSIIEKDYFVTLMLFELVKLVPNLVFKGGTSLSKCYKIIDRFSEDIDLSLEYDYLTNSTKKHLKSSILDICNRYNFQILNLDNIRSRRNFNCYRINYNNHFYDEIIKHDLIVETTFITKAFPVETKSINSIIYDYLKEIHAEEDILLYKLEPFEIKVQSLERTFMDKIFALCDYVIENKIDCHSRHIYDIHKIFDQILIDDDFKFLIKEVREERKQNDKCYSAQDNFNVNEELRRIIDEDIYKEDYDKSTFNLLINKVSYNECILTLNKIVDMNLF